MARVVAVADRLVEHAGIGVPRRLVAPMSEPLFYTLNLRTEHVQVLIGTAERMGAEHRAAQAG